MASGGKAINLGELAIAIALKTGALEAGLKDVQNKLKDHGKKVQNTGADYDKLAIVAGLAFYKISSAISSGIKAFNDFNNSMVGLRSVVQGTGNDFSQAQGFIDNFTADGLIPASDAATGLKNLLARGFGLTEATTILNRFKDSAAFGRQASLSLGEAVKTATEGLKNENSILVDNAGVTKNVSVMWKEYAAELGKGVDSLTAAEKRQAEYNGIIKETRFQLGDAAKYANEFAGAQAKNAAETLKLNQALGSALAPALQTIYNLLNPVISALTRFVQDNPGLVAAIATSATAFLGFITAVTAVGAAVKILTPALVALNVSFGGLMLNPVVLGLTALVAVLAAVAVKTQQARKSQEAYNAAVANHNKLIKDGMNAQQAATAQSEVDQLKKLAATYEEAAKKIKEAEAVIASEGSKMQFAGDISKEYAKAVATHSQYGKVLADTIAKMKELGVTEKDYIKIIKEKERAIFMTTKTTAEDYNSQARIIAQKKADILTTQAVINSYKNAKKGSADWLESEKKLADSFPQFATMSGIKIDAIEKATKAQSDSVDAEWKLTQAKIKMTRMELQEVVTAKSKELEAILAVVEANQIPVTDNGNLYGIWASVDTPLKNIQKLRDDLGQLNKEIDGMKDLEKIDLKNIAGISPLSNLDASFKTYENKALDSALRIHNHKVAMEELTKEQELADLQTILKAYVKTAEERMNLEEQIYQVKQAIREKDLAATEKAIEDEAKKLADRTTNSERWISRQKSFGNLTEDEEITAYNAIIKYHKEYLAKIKADTKIAKDEKLKIIAEETTFIQDQQDKIFQIQKTAVEKATNEYINAKKKQYATEESLENDRLNKKLKALDKEYADKENALKTQERNTELDRLYEEERKYQNAATKAGQDKLKDIQNQIASLNKEATQDALDAEKETRRAAIEQEITDNQAKYKKLNEDLDTEGAAMIAASANYAKLANDEIVKGQSTIASSLKGIITNFDKETNTLITTGMENLKKLIDGYKTIMDSVSLSSNIQLAGQAAGASKTTTTGKSSSVVINDYGNKYLTGVEDIQAYGKELVTGAENASRG